MPHDPAESWKKMNTVDSVCTQHGFQKSIEVIVDTCMELNLTVVGCKAGKHRSPVCAACASEVLQAIGYSVAVVEIYLVQPFLVQATLMAAQDTRSQRGRVLKFRFICFFAGFGAAWVAGSIGWVGKQRAVGG